MHKTVQLLTKYPTFIAQQHLLFEPCDKCLHIQEKEKEKSHVGQLVLLERFSKDSNL